MSLIRGKYTQPEMEVVKALQPSGLSWGGEKAEEEKFTTYYVTNLLYK